MRGFLLIKTLTSLIWPPAHVAEDTRAGYSLSIKIDDAQLRTVHTREQALAAAQYYETWLGRIDQIIWFHHPIHLTFLSLVSPVSWRR